MESDRGDLTLSCCKTDWFRSAMLLLQLFCVPDCPSQLVLFGNLVVFDLKIQAGVNYSNCRFVLLFITSESEQW